MELWEEYLMRHKMPVVRPYVSFFKVPDIYIRPHPPYEQRVWIYFLHHHRRYIRQISEELDDISREWNVYLGRPPFGEQREIIFGVVPYMETLWAHWQDESFNSLEFLPLEGESEPLLIRCRELNVADRLRP